MLVAHTHGLRGRRAGLAHKVGLDRPGTYGVAGDALVAIFEGNRLGEPIERVLEGDVVGDIRLVGLAPFNRGKVDDAPEATRFHVPERGSTGPKGRMQNPSGGLLPGLIGHFQDRSEARRAASVVDEDVDFSEVFDGVRNEPSDVLAPRHIAGKKDGRVPGFHFLERLISFRLRAAIDGHLRPGCEKGLGDSTSYSAASPGERGNFAREVKCGCEAGHVFVSLDSKWCSLKLSPAYFIRHRGMRRPQRSLASICGREAFAMKSDTSLYRKGDVSFTLDTRPIETIPQQSRIPGAVV